MQLYCEYLRPYEIGNRTKTAVLNLARAALGGIDSINVHSDDYIVAYAEDSSIGLIDAPVGFAALTEDFRSTEEDQIIRINALAAHPDYLRQGIGTAVIQLLLDVAHERGVSALSLTSSSSEEALNFYYNKWSFEEDSGGDPLDLIKYI